MISEYRGKRLDNGKWIFGSLVRFDESTAFIMPEFPRATTQSYAEIFLSTAIAVEINTVSQSTGQQAKEKKDTFGGDICECEDGLQNYWYVIEWIFGGWQVVTYKKPESNVRGISDGINQTYLEPEICSMLKVIGNIHDNPELLKVD